MRDDFWSEYERQRKLDYLPSNEEVHVSEFNGMRRYPLVKCTADGSLWMKRGFKFVPLFAIARWPNFRGIHPKETEPTKEPQAVSQ